jgi:allantoicase
VEYTAAVLMQQTKGMPGYAYVIYVDDTSWKNNYPDICNIQTSAAKLPQQKRVS